MRYGYFLILFFIAFLSGIGVSEPIKEFSEINVSGPPSIEIFARDVVYRNGSFIGQASTVYRDNYTFKAVSFQGDGEVNWEKKLLKEGEELVKFANVLEGDRIGVVYNESLEIWDLNGEKVKEFRLDADKMGLSDLHYLKAAFADEHLYVGVTERCCEEGHNFRLMKMRPDSTIVWNKTVKAARNPEGPYTPELTDLEVTEDDSVVMTGIGEPVRDSTEWPENTPEWGNIPPTDYDWRTAVVSSNGTLQWEKTETSGSGKDRPIDARVSGDELHVSGTFPMQEEKLRKTVYSLEDGGEINEKTVQFNGTGHDYDSLSTVDKEFGNDYEDEYYIFKRADLENQDVQKTEIEYSRLRDKIFSRLPEHRDLSKSSFSSPNILNAGNNTYVMTSTRTIRGGQRTTMMAEIDFEAGSPEESKSSEEVLESQNHSRNDSSSREKSSSDTRTGNPVTEVLSYLLRIFF